MRPLGAVTSLLVLSAGLAFGQVRETVNVNLVEVPVTVVDRNGNPVRGLTADKFELIDQGQKRPITSFEVIDFASTPQTRGISPLNPAARRSFLLLFDLSFSSPLGRTKAQEAARNFIARSMQRRDLAAVGTIDIERGFRLLTAFTTDRNILASAVSSPINFRSSDPLQISGAQTFEPTPTVQVQVNPDRHGVDDFVKEIQRGQNRLDDQFNRGRIERQVNLLGSLARTLRMLPGRKQVVFFSEGFDPRLVQGRDARAMTEAMEEMALVEHGEAYKVDSDARFGSSSSLSILDQMSRAFRGSDVVLHGVDIRGVRVQNDLEIGAKINSNDGLFLLSNPTGGEVFRNSNDLDNDLQRMLRQQEVVYILGFQAPTATPGKFHDLKVRLRSAGSVRVFHRAGYYESGAENALERALTNAEIVLNDLPQADIGVAALAAAFPTTERAQVPVILEISGSDLAKNSRTSQFNVEIYVYAFDEDGIVRDRMFQRLQLDLAKVGEKILGSGIKYYATLSLPAGKYAIKSLVRIPESEKRGYARVDVLVPPSSDVAVSPPFFFEEPGKWLMVKGGSHDTTNAAYPFQINGEPFIPSAAVSLRNGEPRQFAVFVYNAAADEVTWEATVSDADGTTRAANPKMMKQLQGDDVTKLMFQYSPEDGDHGAARLDVTIHKKGSTEARKAGVPMVVLKSKGETR
jgi:VWFA-related protein